MDKRTAIETLWDYMCLHQTPGPADCIIGFGCYNEDVAVESARLWRQGCAPRILFTGGLGRNTADMWTESEAVRFARIAMAEGVPESALLIEDRSANSAENLRFSRDLLTALDLPRHKIIGVQKPYMERRLYAAFPIYWPEAEVTVTSRQQRFEEYVAGVHRWGRTEDDTVNMLVGDFHRVLRYPALGYQIPQSVPPEAHEAFSTLTALGYTAQLVR